MAQSLIIRVLKSLVYVDRQRRKRLLRGEAWVAIVLAYLALSAAWLMPGSFETSSTAAVVWTWAMMLVRVLYFHIGLMLLVVGVVAAWKRLYRMAVACVPIVVLTVVLPYLNFGTHRAPPSGRIVRVISANLLMINRNTGPILDEIARSDADIVFLQEYTEHWDAAFKKRFAGVYPHRIIYPQEDSFGAAIYSRHPFVGEGTIDESMGKWAIAQLSAVIDVQGTRIECRNIHLMPPRKLDYTVEHFDEMRDFIQDLSANRNKRVIIAGDFNITASTLQAREITATGFHDAFDDAGVGRGATWPVNGPFRYLPGIRLDHIFLSPNLRCRYITTGTGYGSDHRPLIAEISLDEGK